MTIRVLLKSCGGKNVGFGDFLAKNEHQEIRLGLPPQGLLERSLEICERGDRRNTIHFHEILWWWRVQRTFQELEGGLRIEAAIGRARSRVPRPLKGAATSGKRC